MGKPKAVLDLKKIAGLKPASVICEIMNDDGTMSRRSQLQTFAKEHHLPLVSIQDIFNYRVQNETLYLKKLQREFH